MATYSVLQWVSNFSNNKKNLKCILYYKIDNAETSDSNVLINPTSRIGPIKKNFLIKKVRSNITRLAT